MSEPIINLRVVTAIHFSEKALRSLSAMTFLFDPNWSANQNGFRGITLPFAFFETISDEITQQNDVSEKRVILYEPGLDSATAKDGFRASIVNVVADNIIHKPTVHKLEVLVPYGFVTALFSKVSNFVDAALNLFALNGNTSLRNSVHSVMAIIQSTVSTATRFLNVVTAFTPYNNAMYNMNSLLAMARNRSILKFKSWDSWEYKYVVIGNIVIKKVGTEDDYMHATIELKEIPILTVGVPATSAEAPTKKDGVFMSTVNAGFKSIQTGFGGKK